MDKIILQGLEIWGRHGVLPREKTEKQLFTIDLVLYLDLAAAGRTDDLTRTVDYSRVFYIVKKLAEKESFNLIETLAERIAAAVLSEFPVPAVEVTVKKPRAPIAGVFEYMGVQIKRERES